MTKARESSYLQSCTPGNNVLKLMSEGRLMQDIPFSIFVYHVLAHKTMLKLMTEAKLEYIGSGAGRLQ